MRSVLTRSVAWSFLAVVAAFLFGTVQAGGPSGWFAGMGLLNIALLCIWTAIIAFPLSLILLAIRGRHRR